MKAQLTNIISQLTSPPPIIWTCNLLDTWIRNGTCMHLYCINAQVATTLLVAGSTLAFWIPWRTPFVSTSSYSSVVQSVLGCSYNCRRLTCGLFQLTHMSRDDLVFNWSSSSDPWQPKRRQNITTALTALPQGWVSARKHLCTTYDVDRIFVGLSWELQIMSMTVGSCAQAMSDHG